MEQIDCTVTYEKAGLLRRWGAAFIDGLIPLPLMIIPFVGPLLAIAYELLKDGFFDGSSIGKKILGLKVKQLQDGSKADFVVSMKRNFIFALPYFTSFIPFLGWIVTGIFNAIIYLIEGIMVITDAQGRRLGDRLANSVVIEEQ